MQYVIYLFSRVDFCLQLSVSCVCLAELDLHIKERARKRQDAHECVKGRARASVSKVG